jgi:purine-nucleoside phosphorylase
MRCLGISTITNLAAGLGAASLSHAEVMDIAARTGDSLARVLEAVVGGAR